MRIASLYVTLGLSLFSAATSSTVSDLENPYTVNTVARVITQDLEALKGECKGTDDKRSSCVKNTFYTKKRPENKRDASIQNFVKLLHATSMGNIFLNIPSLTAGVQFLLSVLKGKYPLDKISENLVPELGDMAEKIGFPRLVCIAAVNRHSPKCKDSAAVGVIAPVSDVVAASVAEVVDDSFNDPVYVPNPVEAPVYVAPAPAPVEQRFMTTVELKQSVTLDELTAQVNSGVVALSNSHCDETTCMQSALKPIIISKEAKALAGIIAAAHLTNSYLVQDIVAQLMVLRSDAFMQKIRDAVRPDAITPLACGLKRFQIPALLGVEVC